MPEAVTEKLAAWPVRMDWLTGCVLMEGATATPVPVSETENVELNWALLNEALPDALFAVAGAKVAVKVALLPGFKFSGRATPPRLKPAPDAVAWEIVRAAVPALMIVKLRLLALPTDTSPKLKAAGLAPSAPEGGVEPFVEDTELLLALTTPEQPDKMEAENKSVMDRDRMRMRGVGLLSRWGDGPRGPKLVACVIMTRGV